MPARAPRRLPGQDCDHPDQIPIINAAFTPTSAEIGHAEKIIEAFDSNPALGTVGIDGKMYDMPHLKLARKVKAAAVRLGVA